MWVQDQTTSGVAEFPLGTDFYGRDILSRLLFGTRTAIVLALAAVSIAGLVGTLVGLVSGYLGGRIDTGIMYIVDTINALPGIMFMVIIVLIFRSMLIPSWSNGMLTLVIGFAAVGGSSGLYYPPAYPSDRQTVPEAAVIWGPRLYPHHLLPNVLPVIIV
jgi:ABC-type dipeptide/oligopeptide/nickel transport system permease subunit